MPSLQRYCLLDKTGGSPDIGAALVDISFPDVPSWGLYPKQAVCGLPSSR